MGQIGATEVLIVLAIVLLLVGGKKLPELARGSGRALRIFKREVQELHHEGEDDTPKTIAERRAGGDQGRPA
jgi:sec-independent protein translocase protein TatA